MHREAESAALKSPALRCPLAVAWSVMILLLAGALSAAAAQRVTTPREQFGFDIGEDYHLVNHQQLAAYWKKLERESNRLKVVPIGPTEEGRTMLMAVVTSVSNQRKLERLKDTARRLALAEGLSEAEARRLARSGKAVVCIVGGLHASETLGSQQLIETVYQLVSGTDDETLRILNDVVVLAILANPDGMDLVVDWYMRESEPSKRSLSGVPRLYQKYIGHDNNRDFYAVTQLESKAINRVLYREWFPQIVYDHHQSGPPGTVLFIPPFRDPFNYNIDPRVMNGIDQVGAAMMHRFLAENKPGATMRSGSRYSTWWNGGLRTTCYFHNMIGLLSETIGSPNPIQIPFNARLQVPRGDLLMPVPPQTWHLRQSVDYSVTANRAVLDFASRNRHDLLHNIYRMGRDAIARGSTDHWTPAPSRMAAIEVLQSSTNAARKLGADEIRRRLHAPEARDPRGYILPSDQPDFATTTRFVNMLIETGVAVQRATREFEVQGTLYPAGSYVVSCAQAFRAHVLDMFEPQDHPNDLAYAGGPPVAPYDIAGWTLAYQMGVKFDRVLEGFSGPFERIHEPIRPPSGSVLAGARAKGFFLNCRMNDSFTAVNRILNSGGDVFRLTAPFSTAGVMHPAGTFFIPNTPHVALAVERMSRELGLTFHGVEHAPTIAAIPLRPVRVALWDRPGGSIPSGWTRWLLEQFSVPFEVVTVTQMIAGELSEKFDVIILPGGAVPEPPAPAEKPARTNVAEDASSGGEAPAAANGASESRPRTTTTTRLVAKLRDFLEQGGTVLAIGTSTRLAEHLELPVQNKLVRRDAQGRERPLSTEQFYIPGSVIRARVDTTHPLAYGLEEEMDVMFVRSPVFALPEEAGGGLAKVVWYDSAAPLRSGWALGQEHLQDGIGVLETSVGAGRLVLFGPEVLFRAQSHGTFKLFFNGILGHGAAPAVAPLQVSIEP